MLSYHIWYRWKGLEQWNKIINIFFILILKRIVTGKKERNGTAKESRLKEIETSSPKKRMTEGNSTKPRKKRKLNTNIRDNITCKRWREEKPSKSKDQPSVTQEEQPHVGDCEPGPGQEEQPHDGDCEPGGEVRAQERDDVRVRVRAGEDSLAGEEGPRTPPPPATLGEEQQEVQHHHHQEISCETSMHARMPASIVQAYTGGIGPMGKPQIVETNENELSEDEPREQDDQHHHHHPEGIPTGEEEISCEISMHARMPASIVQAYTGGIGPMGKHPIVETNENELSEDEPREQDDPQEAGEEMQGQGDDHQPQGAGMKGGCEESNQPPQLSREQDDPQSDQHLLEEGGERQDDHQHQGAGEEISCEISMHSRMPGPNVQASQGGIGPNTPSKTSFSNIIQEIETTHPEMEHGPWRADSCW